MNKSLFFSQMEEAILRGEQKILQLSGELRDLEINTIQLEAEKMKIENTVRKMKASLEIIGTIPDEQLEVAMQMI